MEARPLILIPDGTQVVEFDFLSGLDFKWSFKTGWLWWRVDNYSLTNHFTFRVNEYLITIEEGFLTDFASIPPPLCKIAGVTPDDKKWRKASVCHDGAYRMEIFPKWFCDDILRTAIEDESGDEFDADVFHCAVELFGWESYYGHSDKDLEDARKLLTVYSIQGDRVYPA